MSISNACFSVVPDVKDICADYFAALKLDLQFFGHITVFPDGNYHFLCSKRDWPQYGFVDEKIPPAGFTIYDHIQNSIKLPHMESASDLGWDEEVMKVSKERFGIQNLMMIFRKHKDRYEGFSFDLHDKKSHEIYINNLDLFENFIFYYKDRARDLIKMASKNQLQVDEKYLTTAEIKNERVLEAPRGTPSTILQNPLHPKQYFLTHEGKEYLISAREYQCLDLISHGKKIKDLANLFNISCRTIDTHLISLKRKLHVKSLTQAVEIYWANRIGRF